MTYFRYTLPNLQKCYRLFIDNSKILQIFIDIFLMFPNYTESMLYFSILKSAPDFELTYYHKKYTQGDKITIIFVICKISFEYCILIFL